MKNQTQSSEQKSNENDDVFIGRRGYAIDFFEEHPEELIKYAKTKGMFTSEDMINTVDSIQKEYEANGVSLETAETIWNICKRKIDSFKTEVKS